MCLWNLTSQGLSACLFKAQNNDGEGNGDGHQSRPSTSSENKSKKTENQDGGVGRHTAPPRTTRTDRESNSKGDQDQGNRK